MTPRERILAALRHEEPDRVPLDLGATDVTGILAPAYARLRRRLGCGDAPMRLFKPDQLLPEIDRDVVDAVEADALPVEFPPTEWTPSGLLGETPCLVPRELQPEPGDGGEWLLRNAAGEVTGVLPEGGSCFRPMAAPLADVESVADLDRHARAIVALDAPYFAPEDFAALRERARGLREDDDRALVLNIGGHVFAGGQWLMGYEKFMMALALEPALVEALLERIVDAQIERVGRYAAAVNGLVDMVYISDDLGTQTGPQLSPAQYRSAIKPHHARLCAAIRERFDAFLMLHTDGAVRAFIPDLIEIGVQVLNPVQVSATGMDSRAIKADFGADIAFWGGGCEGQHTLPFGSPCEVADEVRRRVDDLAPGGGFVFSHIHNMQPETPAENIIAMYEAFREAR